MNTADNKNTPIQIINEPLSYMEIFEEIIENLNQTQLDELIEEINNQKLLLKVKKEKRTKMRNELKKEKDELMKKMKLEVEKEVKKVVPPKKKARKIVEDSDSD